MASPSQRSTSRRATASRAAGTGGASADSTPQDAAAFAFAQEQLQAAIALADLVFKGAEEIRRTQLEAAHHAHERHEKALAEVASAANPNELFKLQAELLRDDLETAGQYWQQIASAMSQLQAQALSLMSRSGTVEPAPQAAGLDVGRAWNQWADLGKQWTEMLYRTEASLH